MIWTQVKEKPLPRACGTYAVMTLGGLYIFIWNEDKEQFLLQHIPGSCYYINDEVISNVTHWCEIDYPI